MNRSHEKRQFLIAHVVATSWVTSSVGTVEELWVDSLESENEVTIDEMVKIAGEFEAPLMYQHGLALQATDPEAAARYFTKALDYQDDFGQARLALGSVLARQDQLDAAEAELRAVLKEDATNPEAFYQLAVSAIKRGELDEAIVQLEATVREDPSHLLGLNNLTWLLATHDDPSVRAQPRVTELAEHAADLSKQTESSVLATLAVAYTAAGRFEDAVEVIDRALLLTRDSADHSDLEAKLSRRRIQFQKRRPYKAD